MKSKTKSVNITIKMRTLLYDIMAETWLRGKALENDDNAKDVAVMTATADNECMAKMARSITSTLADVHERLSEYITEGSTQVSNVKISTDADIDIVLSMPHNFNDASAKTLAEAIHKFMVYESIAEWYSATNKAEFEEYLTRAGKAYADILLASASRKRPTRPNV